MFKKCFYLLIGLCLLQSACKQGNKETLMELDGAQAISLKGEPLYAPKLSAKQKERLRNNLKLAVYDFTKEPSELNTIWVGRRHAYLGDYKQAIEVYSNGLERFPESYRLYRHRGHRYVSTRQFDKAIADFEKAYALMPRDTLEIEPDGIPNRLNQPLSNTQFNILYHYGLAHYLKGEFGKASILYMACLNYSDNPDLKVATTDWLYMSLMREGKTAQAEEFLATIPDSLEIIENDSYYKRLRMYQGKLPFEELFKTNEEDVALSLATQGYGVANWYLYNGDTTQAKSIYHQILSGDSWSPFGYIAAEADMVMIQ